MSGKGLFGAAVSPGTSATSGNGLFGAAASPGAGSTSGKGLFGAVASTGAGDLSGKVLFGAAASPGAVTSSGKSLFGAAASADAGATNGIGLFGGAPVVASPSAGSGGLFSGATNGSPADKPNGVGRGFLRSATLNVAGPGSDSADVAAFLASPSVAGLSQLGAEPVSALAGHASNVLRRADDGRVGVVCRAALRVGQLEGAAAAAATVAIVREAFRGAPDLVVNELLVALGCLKAEEKTVAKEIKLALAQPLAARGLLAALATLLAEGASGVASEHHARCLRAVLEGRPSGAVTAAAEDTRRLLAALVARAP